MRSKSENFVIEMAEHYILHKVHGRYLETEIESLGTTNSVMRHPEPIFQLLV